MKNTLVILAVAATTAYAQMSRLPPMNPDVLDQRWGCYWQCQDVTQFNENYGEICYDTCTPKLSRFMNQDGYQNIRFIYDGAVWDNGFNRQVFDYADDNDEARVFRFLDDFHEDRLNDGNCWPWWECDWEQCSPEDQDGSGDECWKENCWEDCGTDEKICKIWHAREYDYYWDTWRWEIEDCDQGLVAELSKEAMKASAYLEDNFGESLDTVKESTCPYGECVDQSAMMAAEAVANVNSESNADIRVERAADMVGDALDSFYMNDEAVQFANTFTEEASGAFGVDTDALDKVINAQSSDNLADGVESVVSEQSQDAQQRMEEEDGQWADWISTFVSGLMNRAQERKGERDYDADYADYYYDDYYYEDGDW